jgi:hypothetical protein
LKPVSGRDFARLVERRGFKTAADQRQSSYLRQSWKRSAASIPIHGNTPLKTGLLRHLAKLAEVPDEEQN